MNTCKYCNAQSSPCVCGHHFGKSMVEQFGVDTVSIVVKLGIDRRWATKFLYGDHSHTVTEGALKVFKGRRLGFMSPRSLSFVVLSGGDFMSGEQVSFRSAKDLAKMMRAKRMSLLEALVFFELCFDMNSYVRHRDPREELKRVILVHNPVSISGTSRLLCLDFTVKDTLPVVLDIVSASSSMPAGTGFAFVV